MIFIKKHWADIVGVGAGAAIVTGVLTFVVVREGGW